MKTTRTALSILAILFSLCISQAQRQTGYWQQHVSYKMEIDMDVNTWQYKGSQELTYTNISPDTLHRVFYHLYFNAFQPGSEMDVRSLTISDPDGRVKDRISKLEPHQIGYIKPLTLTQDGKPISFEVVGTVLEVALNQPILPGKSSVLKMVWDAQVPIQIRRSGRQNAEGIALSMTQWYPKLAEYDFEGWHAHPYIGREFHGVWGDFDVKITLDASYTVGGTGYLQNADEVGHGYSKTQAKPKRGKYTWHFVAPNVHDFTWAADDNYIHDTYPGPNGVTLHFFYKDEPSLKDNWKALQPVTAELMQFFNTHIGPYPYEQYSVIQGGDGGMEYAMSTLITGQRKFESLVGVTSHELAHSWFQFLLATNESKHEWMDEGFTSYISASAVNAVLKQEKTFPQQGSYRGYSFLANSGQEQPLTTHADRYALNRSYGISAYSKGAVFLAQLEYVMGQKALQTTLKRYFKDWAFKHPTPTDFIRVAEKVSGMELDWYLTDFAQTTNTIDYAIKEVTENAEDTEIILERKGLMPMPIELSVTYADGSSALFYIPLQMMRADKVFPESTEVTTLPDWAWAYPTYSFKIPNKKVAEVVIDTSLRMADINRENNSYKNTPQ